MGELPAVSVVMPIDRVHPYLSLTLDSVAAQAYPNFELLIVCSSDLEAELVGLLERHGGGFRYRVIGTRLNGFCFALNLAINASTAPYIARWDSDDLSDPDRFARQVAEFEARPRLAVLGTRGVITDKDGRITAEFPFYGTNKAIRRAMKYRPPLMHSSIMFRASVLLEQQGYGYGYTSEDHELYLRLARRNDIEFGCLPDVRTYYRRHDYQRTSVPRYYDQFADIAGFMTTAFLHSGSPLHLLGIAAKVPPVRKIYERMRSLWRGHHP